MKTERFIFTAVQWLGIILLAVIGVHENNVGIAMLSIPFLFAFIVHVIIADGLAEDVKFHRMKCVEEWEATAHAREMVKIYERALELHDMGFNESTVKEYIRHMSTNRTPSLVGMRVFKEFINRKI